MEPFEGDGERWNGIVAGLPGAHLLQTWQWGQVKSAAGWRPLPYLWKQPDGSISAAALILERELSLPVVGGAARVLYAPKGPLLDWRQPALRRQVLADLQAFAKERGAIFVKIDPDVVVGTGRPGEPDFSEDSLGSQVADELSRLGWRFSDEQIQFRNTLIVDLTAGEADLLARMKQKTRYNVRLAQKKAVHIRLAGADDLGLLYRMYAETSVRDGFVIRGETYYRRVWGIFMDAGMAEALVAEVEGQPVAALVVFQFAGKAWYLYGMSRDEHREKMPNYLLQWEAMRRARAAGCKIYDLWGAPDEFREDDPMWGVYRFKEGLGGRVVRTLGAWDYPARPWLYRIYTQTLPRVLGMMRRRGRERTRQEVSAA